MEQRDFKGVWIPKNVWLDSRLNALDKIILMEIDSLDTEENGCYASNEYLSNFCQCSERKVSEAISKLTELNYIYLESFNGRTRVLRSTLSNNAKQTSKICEAESQKNLPIKIEENTNINNKENSSIINNTKEKTKYPEESIYDYYYEQAIKFGYAKRKSEPNNITLTHIKKYLKEYPIDDIERTIDRYYEVINDKTYFFNTYWSAEKFFKQGNTFNDFLEEGSKWINYKLFKEKQKSYNPYKREEISRETKYPEHDNEGYIY